MVVFCGDSWVENKKLPNQWTTHLTKKLYNVENIDSIYNNFAVAGCGNDSICQEQLISGVLPLLKKSKIDYLVLGITYPSRFTIINQIHFQPANGDSDVINFINTLLPTSNELDKEKLIEHYNSLKYLNIFFYKKGYERWMRTINSILDYIESTGTKIIAFNVDNKSDEYLLDNRFYINRKTLVGNYKKSKNLHSEYSNHMTEEENLSLADMLFTEIKN